MSAHAGRKITIYKGGVSSPGVKVASVKAKTLKINREAIDLTNDDDDGLRHLLEEFAGMRSVDLSVEGILEGDQLLATAFDENNADDYSLLIHDIGQIDARFVMPAFQITGAHNEGATFSAEFQSTGAFTYTAGTPA